MGTSLGRLAIFDVSGANARNWNVKPILDVKGVEKTLITALAFDGAQKILAIGSLDGNVKFTDNTGAVLKEFNFNSVIRQIIFSADCSRAMILCDSNAVSIIDLSLYTVSVFSYKYAHPRVVAFGTSSNEIVEGFVSARGEIIKGNIDRNRAISKLYAHDFGVDALTVNAANNLLASFGQDGLIKFWSLDSLQLIGEVNVTDTFDSLIFTTDASTLIGKCLDGSIKIYDVIGCIQTDSTYPGSELNAVALKPDGKFIAAACANGDVCIYSF